MSLFSVNVEVGNKTLDTVKQMSDDTLRTLVQIADTAVIRFELGPETRAVIERIFRSDDGGGGVSDLVKKGADAIRSG
jgi:hypothetical protein